VGKTKVEPGFQPDDAHATTPNLTPRLKRGMGHRAGPLPASTGSTKQLFGARRSGLSGNADLSAYVESIRDQAQTSRCVGAACARVIHVCAQKIQYGAPNFAVPYPSECGLYTLALEEERFADTPMQDQGSVPGLLVQAVTQDVGVPLERDYPEVDQYPNGLVPDMPAEVLAKAIAMKVTAVHTIDSDGLNRVDDAVQTLLEGFAFSMAIPVGSQYENCNSETPVGPAQGTIFGGHDVAILGVKTVNGRRLFLNAGSWGPTFGFGGWVWLDESVLSDPRASDFLVFQTVPYFK